MNGNWWHDRLLNWRFKLHYMDLQPYLMFSGNCEEALNYYAKALGGQVVHLSRYNEAPEGERPPGDTSKVMHATLVAKDVVIMASDSHGPQVITGNSVFLNLNFKSVEEQEKVFNTLAEGGTTIMPLQDTFWGARFGMLTDKFGINWMVNHDKNPKQGQ
jgi:PhnB protein